MKERPRNITPMFRGLSPILLIHFLFFCSCNCLAGCFLFRIFIQNGECNIGCMVRDTLESGYKIGEDHAGFRRTFVAHGFFLAQENFVEEDGKYYPILRAVPGEKENLKAEELFYGPRLLEKENPVLREYLLKQQEQNQTLIRQLSDHSSEKAAQRLWELKEKEAVLESALARFHTM